jgi:hypothetical protein
VGRRGIGASTYGVLPARPKPAPPGLRKVRPIGAPENMRFVSPPPHQVVKGVDSNPNPGLEITLSYSGSRANLSRRCGASLEPRSFAFSYQVAAKVKSGVIPPLAFNFPSTKGS